MGGFPLGRHSLRPLVVLGATGSIGGQTLEVADDLEVPIVAVAARRASEELLAIASRYQDAVVCVVEPGEARSEFAAALGSRVRFGPEPLLELASMSGTTVVNGVVGAAGLRSSIAALSAGNRLALANKESLVAGGPLIAAALESGGGELIPVDSEHSAIFQCLVGETRSSVARLILTASGGPFRGASLDELAEVTVQQALDHPTWTMGPRITIDSATLMNKAFEVIEARYLFGVSYDQISVVVHPQSFVHSFVEFVDGVVKAEVGPPDMKKPIQYAITYPERAGAARTPFSIAGTELTFFEPDLDVFSCLALGYEAGRVGGTATAALNAADEIAVASFLDGQISFLDIGRVVAGVLERHRAVMPHNVEDVEAADSEARAYAEEACGRIRSA
jgi:1-deoxy-D-xylulose-5-phosphate reductoisomerase